jgi:hypothetical protein
MHLTTICTTKKQPKTPALSKIAPKNYCRCFACAFIFSRFPPKNRMSSPKTT